MLVKNLVIKIFLPVGTVILLTGCDGSIKLSGSVVTKPAPQGESSEILEARGVERSEGQSIKGCEIIQYEDFNSDGTREGKGAGYRTNSNENGIFQLHHMTAPFKHMKMRIEVKCDGYQPAGLDFFADGDGKERHFFARMAPLLPQPPAPNP